MVQPDAFEAGVDLAVTPGTVVLQTPVFELIQYCPATATVRQQRPGTLETVPAGQVREVLQVGD